MYGDSILANYIEVATSLVRFILSNALSIPNEREKSENKENLLQKQKGFHFQIIYVALFLEVVFSYFACVYYRRTVSTFSIIYFAS